MKTAISIPDSVFVAAEEAARRMSLSRSELYTRAVREYLLGHGYGDVTKQLDRVYSEESSAVDPALAEMQGLSVAADSW